VLIYFRKDLWEVITTWLRSLRDPALRSDPHARMGWYIIVATIPIGVLGLVFKDQIETGARDLYLIGGTLIVFGLIMGLADSQATLKKSVDDLDLRSGFTIGVAQALALVPGVSRSGATISAGLMFGLTREAAARFSFLLAIPAVLASGLFELVSLAGGSSPGDDPWWAIALATVIAFVVGYTAIAWLLRYLTHHSLRIFVGYRVALGSLVLLLAATGAIS
jgi:undecaprenyl-diphosphatase